MEPTTPTADTSDWKGRVLALDLSREETSIYRDLRLRYPAVIDLHFDLDGPTGPGWAYCGKHRIARLEHTGEPLRRYLVGPSIRIAVCYEPPTLSLDRWIFLGLGGYTFDAKRGFIEEWRSRNGTDGQHIYARVLPKDAEAPLDAIDAEISEAEERLKQLRKDRQDLLLAAAQRGDRVRVKKGGAQ